MSALRSLVRNLWRRRDVRRAAWAEDVWRDVRYGARMLARSPGFTALALTMLALGIAVNTTVFTVTYGTLFRGFPHVDPNDRLVYIATTGGVSYPDFEDWRAQATSVGGLAVVGNGGLRLRLNDQAGLSDACDGTRLSANAFQVLGQKPILGRDFAASDEKPGAPPVAILSYGLWEHRYGQDPSIVGQTVRLDDVTTTVIGVMARGFDFPHHRVDLWLPLTPSPSLRNREARTLWFAFGRLADGVSIRGARAEMNTLGRRLESAYPLTNRGFRPVVMNFHEFFIGRNAATIYGAMWGAVCFVLLITCANVATLLLARANGRSHEMSVRIALGAGRWRIVRQLLIESVMLSAVGGLVAWWLTVWSVRAYELAANPPSGYNQWDYMIDARVFAYLIAISIGTGVLFGAAPASRLSTLEVNTMLKSAGRGASRGRSGARLSSLLVVAEMTLAVVLLAGAAVMIRSFLNIYTADLGVKTGQILTAAVRLPVVRYPDSKTQVSFYDRLMTRLEAVPGVDSVTLANVLPTLRTVKRSYELAGAPPLDEQRRPTIPVVTISPAYFGTLGASVLAGRGFTDDDDGADVPVVMVNERFAKTIAAGSRLVGTRLRLFNGKTPGVWRTVVGVASNIVQNDATGQTFDPLVYVPFRQESRPDMTVLARTRVPPASLGTVVRHEIQAIDPDLVIFSGLGSVEGPKPLTESLAFTYWPNRLHSGLFSIFAGMALLLASVGLYAVVACSVSQRTQEIGIRTALGATARDIRGLVFREGMLPVSIGLATGVAASFGLTPLLQSQLVQVSPFDPVTLVVVSGVLIASATLGCWIPARRATRVDPMVALKHE